MDGTCTLVHGLIGRMERMKLHQSPSRLRYLHLHGMRSACNLQALLLSGILHVRLEPREWA